ncbi:MAG: Flp pilus assembly protein CpaB [Verrucomicrobiae bacterium]|nr:Flp pilus assembly protein CpaB [Verrucomicrobiae bacterium]
MGRSRSTLLLLLVSAALAGLGIWLMNDVIAKRTRQVQVPQAPEDLVSVVFTARDIPMRTEIRTDMLSVRQIPRKALTTMGIEADVYSTPDETAALFSKVPMVSDEILRRSKLTTREEATALSFRVPEGKRAVTVSIEEAKAVGYAIVPGDRVDVIGLFEVEEQGQDTIQQTQTVLQDVEVLEINVGNTPNQQTSTRPVATLAVTPEQAEVLVLTELSARIHFALRNFRDTAEVQSDGTSISEVLGRTAAPTISEVPAPKQGPTIEIFSGANKTSVSVPR